MDRKSSCVTHFILPAVLQQFSSSKSSNGWKAYDCDKISAFILERKQGF